MWISDSSPPVSTNANLSHKMQAFVIVLASFLPLWQNVWGNQLKAGKWLMFQGFHNMTTGSHFPGTCYGKPSRWGVLGGTKLSISQQPEAKNDQNKTHLSKACLQLPPSPSSSYLPTFLAPLPRAHLIIISRLIYWWDQNPQDPFPSESFHLWTQLHSGPGFYHSFSTNVSFGEHFRFKTEPCLHFWLCNYKLWTKYAKQSFTDKYQRIAGLNSCRHETLPLLTTKCLNHSDSLRFKTASSK